MKITYEHEAKMGQAAMTVVFQANDIIAEYAQTGFDLTLRQLYYQFVARRLIPNSQKEYKKLGEIIGKGRMAGLIDWDAITDRTRALRKRAEWENPQSVLDVVADQFRIDLWKGQKYRPEVWVEKDALVGVFSDVCETNGVAYFSCRGYTSLSELWSAAQRLRRHIVAGQTPIILHFGDHDPSGKDMTRDIIERVACFVVNDLVRENDWDSADVKQPFLVKRIALNMPQIEEYKPPPNPAKIADPRAAKYIEEFGDESWELDALDPRTLVGLAKAEIVSVREDKRHRQALKVESTHRADLARISKHYPELVKQAAAMKEPKE